MPSDDQFLAQFLGGDTTVSDDDFLASFAQPESVEEQRRRLYANAMPADELDLGGERSALSSIASKASPVGATLSAMFGDEAAGIWEDTLESTASDIGRSIGNFGSNTVGGALWGTQEYIGDLAAKYGPSEQMREAGERVSSLAADEREKQAYYRDEFLGMADPTISEGRKSGIRLASNLPQLGMFAVNPALGLGVVGAQAFGEEASTAKAEGASLLQRGLSGATTAAAEIVAEKVLGDARLLKSIKEAAALPVKSARAAIRNILVNAGLEGSDESISYVLSRAGQEAIYLDSYAGTEAEKKAQRNEDWEGLKESFKGGAFVGAGATGASLKSASRTGAAPPPMLPNVGSSTELPTSTPVESALAEVEALANDARMEARERELAELPIGLEMAEVEQQIDVLRMMEDQARLRAEEAAAKAAAAFVNTSGTSLDDTVTDAALEDATVAEIPAHVTDQTLSITKYGDQTIQDRRRGVLADDETVSISDLADETMAGEYRPSSLTEAETDQTVALGELADATLGLMPRPVSSTESVAGETREMSQQVRDAQAAKEAVAIAQSPDSSFEMVMGGDPSTFGSAEHFAAQRVQFEEKLLNLRQRYEEARAGVEDAGDGAAKEVMTDAEAREALATIRRGALEQALRHGDTDLFDRLDVETKRRLNLFPAEMDDTISTDRRVEGSLPETMAELRDVTFAAMPHVEAKANETYDILAKTGSLPTDEMGQSVPREIFVREQVLAFQTGLTNKFRDLTFELRPDKSNAHEIQRKARTLVNRHLKKFNLTRKELGFRGDAAIERQGVIDAGAEWLRGQMGDKGLTDFADADLASMARTARQSGAPLSTFNFIRNELKRRQSGQAPVRYAPSSMDPQRALALAQRGVDTETDPKLREIMGADPDVYRKGKGYTALERSTYWWRKFVGRMGGLFRSNTALGPAKLGPKGAFSNHYYNADLADSVFNLRDPRERNAAIKLMGEARDASFAAHSALHHKINSWAVAVQKSLKEFVAAEHAAGRPTSLVEAETSIYEAVTERKVETLPPALQQIVKDSEPIRTEFREYARQLAKGDPAKLAEIERLGDAYIYRSYAIHKDPDALFREVDKTSAPYKSLYNRVVREGYAPLYEFAYEQHAPKLREAGYTEPQIDKVIEETVLADMVPGLIEGIVKQTLANPDTQAPVASRIGKAKKEILIERVNEDPDLRAILGEEKVFTLAMVTGMEKVATDMAKLRMTTDLMNIWRKNNLVGDTWSQLRTVPLSAAKLDKITEDDADVDVIYVTPEVNSVLSGVRNATDGFDQLSSEFIAFIKMGYVANPGTAGQNWWGLGQTILTAGGLIGTITSLRKKAAYIRLAHLIARETSFPGSGVGKLKAEKVSKLFADLGYTPETLERAVFELQQLGLDSGGEMSFELEKGAGAILSGVERVSSGGIATKAKKVTNWAMEIYRHPDLMAKMLAHRLILDELMEKADVTEAPLELSQEAAKMALNTTQNPKTTPEIIRAMNKGKLGLLSFTFAGFQYQMMRNLYYSSKYAVNDARAAIRYGTEASHLDAAGNALGAAKAREKAKVYGKYAISRASGVATASYLVGEGYQMMFALLGKMLGGDDEHERERHLKALLPYKEARANKLAPIAVWNQGGKTYATVAHSGKVDIYDGAMSVLRKLVESPTGETDWVPDDGADTGRRVLAAMSLMKEQFTGLSGFADAMGMFMRTAQREHPTMADWGETAMDALAKLSPKVGVTPMETIGRAKKAMAAGAMEISSEFPFFEGDPTNKDFEKFRRNIARWGTGVGVQTIPVNDYYSSRTHDVWGEASWRREARAEWAAASTPSARIKVKAKYVDKWTSLQNSLWNLSEHGIGAGLTPAAMRTSLGDEEVTKYKGDKIPKWMHQRVAYRQNVSFDTYLNEITKGMR